jgi:phage terminase large subunit
MEEIFNAIEAGERKILVRSCNGAGKTTALAAICNWYFSTYKDSIVLTTASSSTQVRRNLWGEIRKQARSARLYRGKSTTSTNTSIHVNDKHFMLGISPAIPENAMGFHAPHMLIAVDEATGIDTDIIDALMGNLTGVDAQIVMICNPIASDSFAYEAEASGEWHVIAISAFDHPNVKEGNEKIKGAVTRRWIEDRMRAWSYEIRNEELGVRSGVDAIPNSKLLTPNSVYVQWLNTYYYKTPIVASRICGEWADYESEGFISMDVIRKCVRKTLFNDRSSMITEIDIDHRTLNIDHSIKVMGVDVARSGPDSTVFAYFDGDRQLPFETFQAQDTMRTAELIKARYDAGWRRIAIDDTGVGGGVTDRLRQLGVPVIAVNFGQSPKGFLKQSRMIEMANARAEMYFLLEMELRNREIEIVDDAAFHQELAAIRLSLTESNALYRLEEKELARRRLGRSPDKADATALARYALRLPLPRLEPIFFM